MVPVVLGESPTPGRPIFFAGRCDPSRFLRMASKWIEGVTISTCGATCVGSLYESHAERNCRRRERHDQVHQRFTSKTRELKCYKVSLTDVSFPCLMIIDVILCLEESLGLFYSCVDLDPPLRRRDAHARRLKACVNKPPTHRVKRLLARCKRLRDALRRPMLAIFWRRGVRHVHEHRVELIHVALAQAEAQRQSLRRAVPFFERPSVRHGRPALVHDVVCSDVTRSCSFCVYDAYTEKHGKVA